MDGMVVCCSLFWFWECVGEFAKAVESFVAEASVGLKNNWCDVMGRIFTLLVVFGLRVGAAGCDRCCVFTRQGCLSKGGGDHNIEVDCFGGGVPGDVSAAGAVVVVRVCCTGGLGTRGWR